MGRTSVIPVRVGIPIENGEKLVVLPNRDGFRLTSNNLAEFTLRHECSIAFPYFYIRTALATDPLPLRPSGSYFARWPSERVLARLLPL